MKERLIQVLVWLWGASIIAGMAAVYFLPFQWMVFIGLYFIVSLAIAGFVAGAVNLRFNFPKSKGDNESSTR